MKQKVNIWWKKTTTMNNNIIELKIQGQPETCTAQERKISWKTGMTYLPLNVKKARERYYDAVKDKAPDEPWNCPIECSINFRFYQKNGKPGHWKTTKPDLDNASKLLIDQLARAGFFVNDSRICRLMITKSFVKEEAAGITIELRKLDDEVHRLLIFEE